MINLIPPQAKRALLIEYWIRVVAFWAVMWSVALVIGSILLMPAEVLINYQTLTYAESAELAAKTNETFESVAPELVEASQQARYIIDESAVPRISAYLDALESVESASIRISSISIKRTETGFGPVSISGVADTRSDLAAYSDRLVAHPLIESAPLPFSNLAQDQNLSFSLVVELNQNQP
tara:strand:- start:7941 stop:8483 length:543 start_codon:yes stop_codon:yes gene_type:complete